MQNKTKQVFEYLKTHKEGITSWDAIKMFRATRLSAIIFNLKKDGHIIRTTMEESLAGARYGRYTYLGEIKRG